MRVKFSLILLVALLAGCDQATTAPSDLPTAQMRIGTKTYSIEITNDEASREHGLMERDSLPGDHGMIFSFAYPSVQKFWMHHTRFPLDIIFLDPSGVVVSIHQMKAYDESTTSSDVPAQYAIELSLGAAADNGVKVGDHIDVPDQSKQHH